MTQYGANLRMLTFAWMKRWYPTLLLIMLSFVSIHPLLSQKDSLNRKSSILAYPVGFYLPETRFGAGVAGSFNFYLNKKDSISPPSQIQIGAAYTQNRQLLLYLPFDIYWNKRKHQVSGELGYYDYMFFFFGTTALPTENRESFYVRLPRLRVQYTRKLTRHWYAGLKGWYDRFDIYKYSERSSLENGPYLGREGGAGSGVGAFILFDKRDNVYASKTGSYLELYYHNYDQTWGSDFNFHRYRIDYRYFLPIKKSVVAFQAFGDFMTGDVPFFQMTGIGGPKRFRGYVDGKVRDHHAALTQLEWRSFFAKRWGYTVFAGGALVRDEIKDLTKSPFYYSAGLGVRYVFDIEKHVHIRLDAAFGRQTNEFYFTIGEAF